MNNKYLLATLVSLICISGGFYFKTRIAKQGELVLPFPYTKDISNNTSFSCTSIISTAIIGGENKANLNGIRGEVLKGTDTIAMEIKDANTLLFNTGASIKAGMAGGDDFVILQNDNKTLVAVWYTGTAIHTIILNKTNGLGAWYKGNPEFPIYGTPSAGVVYMSCI